MSRRSAGEDEPDGRGALPRRTLLGAAGLVAAAALAPAAAATPGRSPAARAGAPRAGLVGAGAAGDAATGGVTALPPTTLPPANPTPPTIAPVALGDAARDGSGVMTARSSGALQLVAVTWTGNAPDDLALRSTDAAGAWGAWLPLDAHAAARDDQPDRAGGGTDPVWVGDRSAVQVRASRGGAPVTDGLAIQRIDPGSSTNDTAIGARARDAQGRAAPAEPAYVSRAQWGADPKLMTWPPQYTPTVRAVTIHHTSETNDYTPEQSAAIVRGIYAYHSQHNGWGDIGYNALVDKYGTIFEGRSGGLDKPVIAAHAGGFNRETFGIALMGNLTTTWPTPPQGTSVGALCAWKLGGMYRDPTQRIQLTSTGGGTAKYAKGRVATVPALFAHRDVGNTACPGNLGYAAMDSLRNDVTKLIAEAGTDVRSAWSSATPALGQPTRVESATADGRGRYTDFERGSIYWSPATGAHQIAGAIRDAWRARGAESGPLGLPTGEEYTTHAGRAQAFEHGVLRWNRTTNAVTQE